MTQIIIEAQELEYRYPSGLPVLRGLDLPIAQGRRLAVIGANGAGKSTLLLHLNGILRPDRGTILLDGRPVDYGRRGLLAWRRQVGLVFQDPDDQLFAASVFEDISFGPLNLGLSESEARARAAEAMEALEIAHLRDRPPHRLSFGQKKRTAIAGVIAMRPRVLVLDEPSAGLDHRGTEHLLATLERLHRSGLTLVMATNDIDLAYGWADETVILHDGRVVRRGDPGAVLGDENVLAPAGLRPPWVLEIGSRLGEMGWISPNAAPPRTRAELLARLSGAQCDKMFLIHKHNN